MRLYEAVIILDNNTDTDKKVDDYAKLLESKFAVQELTIDRWGKKRFAYEINRRQYGDYTAYRFMADPKLISEMEHEFRITEDIIRFLIYRVTKNQLKQNELDKKKYNDVAHHTIYFGKSYEKHLDKIFEKKILSDDISYYLHRPSATDPNMAPYDQDAFYVLVPVPNNLSKINWIKEGDKFKNLILEKMDKTVLPGIKENVVSDFYLTPDYFEIDLSTLHGSGFSIQPKFSQSAYFRFHNQSEIFKNLYFVGAGTHPGAGMPGVLSSAKVLDKLF